MSDMPSNPTASAQSEPLPMQGKVMNTVKGPDGQVTYKFDGQVIMEQLVGKI